MSTTIRRNWTTRIRKIQETATACRAYESSSGNMVTVDPARAFQAWQGNGRATLTEVTPGQKWRVHVHSNHFYVLTATSPERNRQETAPAAPVPAQGDRGGVTQASAAGRRAAHRLAAEERPEERPARTMPRDRALELARQSEERYRPTAVYVYVSPVTRTAALRWLDAEGRDCPGLWEPVPLEGLHGHAMQEEVLNAAGLVLAKRGLTYERGAYWQPYAHRGATVDTEQPEAARVAITPTPAYLDFQARRFGPVPELPEVPGVTFEATQRGQWRATITGDGRTFLLTWSPRLDGDRWHVWGGDQHSELVRSSTSMDKALFVLRYPAHARP
ncbi:hypothetical protein QEH48_gp110 [Streptomyces phage TurkishDelight]|uniref:Uncharacterized protein n=1 Tax=Streptomyces phage TurkishDelight TaxID=2793708 RepID=A0A7T0Q598_9CAUD|nr:hypothetical protein QEH48_gp110 [Streptomyces phage TurkishDelight]QPL14139.1 hypothetical protein SEA_TURKISHDELIGHT_110 [Streptomyces phage TurkishDelight]